MHLDALHIDRFRGLRDLALHDLGRINLLVGRNSSGKTSVLEAIEALCQPLEPTAWVNLARRRYLEPELSAAEALRWLAPQEPGQAKAAAQPITMQLKGAYPLRGCQAGIQILKPAEEPPVGPRPGSKISSVRAGVTETVAAALGIAPSVASALVQGFSLAAQQALQNANDRSPSSTGNARLTLSVEYVDEAGKPRRYSTESPETAGASEKQTPALQLPVAMIAPFSHRLERLQVQQLSSAEIEGWHDQVVDLLKQVDGEIEDIEVLDPNGTRSQVYVRHRKAGVAPIGVLGDGVRRALVYALALPKARGGVLLIDELETAIHVSVLARIFGWLVRACEAYDVQLFATTHSLEALDAILTATSEHQDQVVGYRLGGAEPGKRFAGPLLHSVRFELGQDIR